MGLLWRNTLIFLHLKIPFKATQQAIHTKMIISIDKFNFFELFYAILDSLKILREICNKSENVITRYN